MLVVDKCKQSLSRSAAKFDARHRWSLKVIRVMSLQYESNNTGITPVKSLIHCLERAPKVLETHEDFVVEIWRLFVAARRTSVHSICTFHIRVEYRRSQE